MLNVNLNSDESSTILDWSWHKLGLAAYSECLKSTSDSNPIHLRPADDAVEYQDENLLLTLTFTPSVKMTTTIDQIVCVGGCEIMPGSVKNGDSISDNDQKLLIIKRDTSKVLKLAAVINGKIGAVTLPPVPPPLVVRHAQWTHTLTTNGPLGSRDKGGAKDAEETICWPNENEPSPANLRENEEYLISTAGLQANVNTWTPAEQLIRDDPKLICYNFHINSQSSVNGVTSTTLADF